MTCPGCNEKSNTYSQWGDTWYCDDCAADIESAVNYIESADAEFDRVLDAAVMLREMGVRTLTYIEAADMEHVIFVDEFIGDTLEPRRAILFSHRWGVEVYDSTAEEVWKEIAP